MSLRSKRPTAGTGSVALVGAGPGDPELMTVKALRALKEADVVLYDHLVSADVLALSPAPTRRIPVGKIGHGPSCRQSEINSLMIALARAGHRVVRLKGGDPSIFGRSGEEIDALDRAGIACDVIPGISAVQAAAASLRTSLTHRKSAQRLQIVTGHSKDGGLPPDLCWEALLDPGVTTAIYMGQRTLADFVAQLLGRGLDKDHPAAAVFDASRPTERIIRAPIARLPTLMAAVPRGAPCLVLLGHVLDTADVLRRAATSLPRNVNPGAETHGA